MPFSGQDVPDDADARLVVLSIEHPYSKAAGSAAEVAAKAILESRGNAPRLFQNTLAFLAIDDTRLQDLDEAARRYLAWESILDEKDELDLTPHQVKQAESQLSSADRTVAARLPEAYQWLLVPVQATPQDSVKWEAFRLSGQDPLAERASKKLRNDELLVTALAGTRLRMELDRVPLWRGDCVPVRQLAEDFARYLYLPRLVEASVLRRAIEDGLNLITWQSESFAYADSYDEATKRFLGLRARENVTIADGDPGLLVRPEVARKQLDAEAPKPVPVTPGGAGGPGEPTGEGGKRPDQPDPSTGQHRFHGSAALNPTRVGRDAGRIADEVISHLAGLVGAEVHVTLEIDATIPSGAPDHVVRIVTENCTTLKFTTQGFEDE
jgi:hypothetical protein